MAIRRLRSQKRVTVVLTYISACRCRSVAARWCCGWLVYCGGCAALRPIETGLFEIQADMGKLTKDRHVDPNSRQIVYALFRPTSIPTGHDSVPSSAAGKSRSPGFTANPSVELARCFLRLANLPNFALDRLSRYEGALWRQLGQTLFALDVLDRRKPQERSRRFGIRNGEDLPKFSARP
jgi:hypothetical protein